MTEPGLPLTPTPADQPADDVVFDPQAVRPAAPSRLVRGGIVLGSALLFVVGAMAAMGASPTPTMPGASVAPSASTDPAASAAPSDSPDTTKPGRGAEHFGFGGFGFDRGGFGHGSATITSIDGSNLALETADGWVRTITVEDDTVITRAGTTIDQTDLSVGDQIAFRQQLETDGSYTITAIAIVLPKVGGQVTAVDGSTITVTRRDGTSATIHVSADTTYTVDGKTGAALSDVTVGSFVVATGTLRDDGSLDAESVHSGTFDGQDGHGRHGPGFPGAPDADPNASPAPSATPG
jgi:hypothetical protein